MDINEIVSEIKKTQRKGYANYVTVRGLRIRYLAIGAGDPVILLHGFGGFLETWAFNIPPLSRRYRVYAIDLPGHGFSDRPEDGYTPASAVDYSADIMDALGIERAHLVGHSLGGAVSLNIALNLPHRVSKLVLVDSAGLTRTIPWMYRLGSLPLVGRILTSLVVSPVLERSTRRLLESSPFPSGAMAEVALENMYRPSVRKTLVEILQHNLGVRGPRPEIVMIDRLPGLTMPTLFVHGAQDRMFPLADVQEAFTKVPGARVHVFEQCGHTPQIERILGFNQVVLDFLG